MKVELTEVEISALIQDLGAQGISERIVLGAFQKGVEFALNKRIHKPLAPAILVVPLIPRGETEWASWPVTIH